MRASWRRSSRAIRAACCPSTPSRALQGRALAARAREAGSDPGVADLTKACIARAHGLAVATRNLRHFGPMGVEAVDPFG